MSADDLRQSAQQSAGISVLDLEASPMTVSSRIAIIAGAGSFPLHVAREAKRQGASVSAVGIRGWVDPALAGAVEAYEEVAVGELGRLIQFLKARQIPQVVMAGKVTKAVLLDQETQFDPEAIGILRAVRDVSVTGLLGAIGERLSREGIRLLDSSTFLQEALCPVGPVTARGPSVSEQADIQVGLSVARTLAALDVGQTVVVKGRVVIAVEALEGTDATIRRAQTLAGRDLVVVKAAAPDQDRRFDLPVIGLETVTSLQQGGVSCLAVEAGTTLLLDRAALIAAANAAGMCLVGVPPPSS
jgi:DUF1009 family protein